MLEVATDMGKYVALRELLQLTRPEYGCWSRTFTVQGRVLDFITFERTVGAHPSPCPSP